MSKSYCSVNVIRLGHVVRTLINRGNTITTKEADRVEETKHIEKVLKKNKYPNTFIKRTHRKIQRQATRQGNRQPEGRETQNTVVIPYIQGISEHIIRLVKPYAKAHTKPATNLRHILSKPKDKREKHQNKGVVYRYTCQCGKLYIGETCRTIKTRQQEHMRAITNADYNHSGLSKHVLETGHTISWEGVEILAYENQWKKRKIKEGIFIAKTKKDKLLNTNSGWQMADMYNVL